MSELSYSSNIQTSYLSDGLVFDIERGKLWVPSSPITDQMFDVWNPDHYANPRVPLHIGSIVAKQEFSRQNQLSAQDMPIKFPNSDSIRLPSQLCQFKEAISKICTFESAINPRIRDYFAYLTADQRSIKPGSTQRVPGKHVDGIQGKNVPIKFPVEQTYLVSDTLPTTAYVQPFDFSGKRVERFNWFRIMEEQAKESHAVRGEPYEIYLIDPYTVHAGTPADTNTARTFLRLEFSLREYDRLGNTHNPLFDYRWSMKERPVSDELL